jgi:hypothetical protein
MVPAGGESVRWCRVKLLRAGILQGAFNIRLDFARVDPGQSLIPGLHAVGRAPPDNGNGVWRTAKCYYAATIQCPGYLLGWGVMRR